MFEPTLLLNQRVAISEIFADYGDLEVRIGASPESADSSQEPDVDILVNLDEARNEQVVVCIHKPSRFTRKPFGAEAVRAVEWFDVCMDLTWKLNALLDCSVIVVDARGLKSFYPLTYSKLMRFDQSP